MRRLPSIILTLAIAAQAVCACPAVCETQELAPSAPQRCSGTDTCCRKQHPAGNQSSPDHRRCDRCNLEHRPDQAQPDRDPGVVALQPCDALPPAPWFGPPTSGGREMGQVIAEGVPIPPLLQDLFHTSILLLI